MKYSFLTLTLTLFTLITFASPINRDQKITWNNLPDAANPLLTDVKLGFEGAVYDIGSGSNPWFRQKIMLDAPASHIKGVINNAVYQELTARELLLVDNLAGIAPSIEVQASVAKARDQYFAVVSFLPFRLNVTTGKYEKLVGFTLELTPENQFKSGASLNEYADNSVLSSGDWYRLKVQETGVYKLTLNDLETMGIPFTGVSSSSIRLYGNGGGMLPEANSEYRPDDLQENAIEVVDGGDNVFGDGDYILFYGESPDSWKPNDNYTAFDHQKNVYSDYTYYYLTTKAGQGKRIQNLASTGEAANVTVNTFNDYAFHENDDHNLIGSGRRWLGEIFDLQVSYDFNFSFPNLNTSAEHYLEMRTVAKSPISSTFAASINGSIVSTMPISGTPDNPNGYYARDNVTSERLNLNTGDINFNLKYNKSQNTSIGWLDYIQMNVTRNLVFSGGQMAFRNLASVGQGNIAEFNLGGAGQGVNVWDVTSQADVKNVELSGAGNQRNFRLSTGMLREFVAFDGSAFLTPEFDQQIPNQNLHGQRNIEYVIISHPDFLDQANRLADFHREHSGMSVLVVTPQQVYNEFSSGAQDITAIKDLMRMLYIRGQQGDVMPKYLLLFGDASYDYKDRLDNNTNFIPTYESPNSLHYNNSYATDDYFGFLDEDEGDENTDLLDIGIGRFVVDTPEEAKSAVDKVLHYATSDAVFGNWCNVVTFVADDEDGNTHLNQAEQLASFVDTTYPSYNVDKIYIDAYKQESTPGGQRYPDVNEAINSRIEKGTLIMNYTGHGGEVGWGHERILEVQDINEWANKNRLAVFVTATCEFARYDDPERTSAGEFVFLNPRGGGIALFTTARATFGGSNLSLNRGFYKYAFEKHDGQHYAMGDLIRLAKLESTSSTNDKKFVLIGDPALKFAYPTYNILTTSINQSETSAGIDTLRALSKVTINGIIADEQGNLVSDFNGHLQSTVFDKESEVTTLGQDESSSPRTFLLRKNTIYNGKSTVIDGEFTFSFIVPKDIAYNFGRGKISYYAQNGSEDASGYNMDIVIGGYNDEIVADTQGPDIELFMNDTTFRNGDITHENPVLIARVYDESGINTVGNSIGHDITAILNGNTEKPYKLNEFYESDLKGYQSGIVTYPFSNLTPGEHEITFRIWDVYNNSSEATIKFTVIDRSQIAIQNAYNRPNPFTYETWFEYNHNQANEPVDVIIEIYDLNGRLVTTLQQNNTSTGFYATPIRWNGTAANGNYLKGGIYVYRVRLTNVEGRTTSAVKKLVIAR